MKKNDFQPRLSNQRITNQEIEKRIDEVFNTYGNPQYIIKEELETYFLNKENLSDKEILHLWGRAVDLDCLRIGATSLGEEEKERLRRVGKLDERIKKLHSEGCTNPTTYSVVVFERIMPEEMAEEREFEEENLREHQEEWMKKQERDINT